ncbi:tRNA-dependent cyclodipeptide synthase [Nocardiopsis aegyptia]
MSGPGPGGRGRARPDGTRSRGAVRSCAAGYRVAEVPLCMDAPAILRTPTSVNIHHQVLPMIPIMFDSARLCLGQ